MTCGCSFSRKKSKGRNKYKKRSHKRSRKSSRKSYRKRKSKVARKSIKRKGSRKRSNKRKKSKRRKFKSVVINRNRMAVSNRLFNNGKSYLGSFGRSGRMFNRYSKYTVGNSFRNSPIGGRNVNFDEKAFQIWLNENTHLHRIDPKMVTVYRPASERLSRRPYKQK